MSPSKFRYAVIIPHYEDHTRLERCLDALMRNDLQDCEILVVDNNSPTPLDTIRQKFPSVSFVTEPTKGAAAARNRGVVETTAPRIFFLDADCVPAENWVRAARANVAENTVVGGQIYLFDEGDGPRTGAQGFEAVFAFNQRRYIEDIGFSVTANLLTTRAVFKDVGPMIVGVSEDLEWCQRATAKGYTLRYAEDLIAGHPSRGDWEALQKKWKRLTSEAFELERPKPYGRLKWALRGLVMPLSAVLHTPKVLRCRDLKDISEKRRALITLIRLRFVRAGWMLSQSITR